MRAGEGECAGEVFIVGIVLLMTLWVAVQFAWRRVFPEIGDEDVLSGRGGCGGCNHHGRCENEEAHAGKIVEPEHCDFRPG